jgi:uncharacterized membrane protein YoaK (UPF0700 family)
MRSTENQNLQKLTNIADRNQKVPPSLQLACALVFGVVMLYGCSHANAQQATFRDSFGRTVGTTATTGNMTTYRDSNGRVTGTGTRDSLGTTIYRGQTTGSAPRGTR